MIVTRCKARKGGGRRVRDFQHRELDFAVRRRIAAGGEEDRVVYRADRKFTT